MSLLYFGRACDQMAQKYRYLAKNVSFGLNLARWPHHYPARALRPRAGQWWINFEILGTSPVRNHLTYSTSADGKEGFFRLTLSKSGNWEYLWLYTILTSLAQSQAGTAVVEEDVEVEEEEEEEEKHI